MPIDHNDPGNSAVKPGLSTSEGKIALVVVLVTTLGPVFTALAGAMPDDPRVRVAVAILACLTSVLTTLGYLKGRNGVKENANTVAGGLAAIDKVATIAKEHPELAAALLKSAGIGPAANPGP